MPAYTENEESYIRENYLTKTLAEIGVALNGRSAGCISEKIKKMHGMPSKRAIQLSKKAQQKYKSFASWASMMTRCHNPKRPSWVRYGGRGIVVCERWKKFNGFLEDMGEKPAGYSIDRINPNGNYEPENCRWIPNNEQSKTSVRYLAIGACVDCGKRRGNYASRCHRCHEYFRRNKSPRPKTEGRVKMKERPKKICLNCKKLSRPVVHMRCKACAEYFRRTALERPNHLCLP